jgi:hypothetical protein
MDCVGPCRSGEHPHAQDREGSDTKPH